jgi:hypothetical protein
MILSVDLFFLFTYIGLGHGSILWIRPALGFWCFCFLRRFGSRLGYGTGWELFTGG